MGAAFGAGFTALATALALMGVGVATLALVVLGIGMMFSIFDHGVMRWIKDALLRIIGGAAIVGGQLAVGDQESTEVRFVEPSELDGLPMGQSTRLRIQHFLERRATPYFA